MSKIKLQSDGTYFGQPITLACDLECDKAWGINNRPRVLLSTDEDDYAYLADHELDTAPVDPGTYEGDCAKPTQPEQKHNKWCCRECERCRMVDRDKAIVLSDHSQRFYNIPASDLGQRQDYTVYWTKAGEQGEFYVSTKTLSEALDIAKWQVDLYARMNGAEITMVEGIMMPAHGSVEDYA